MTVIVEDLSVSIAGRRLVDGVGLTLTSGERTALVGASGAGKSLACAALAGTLPPGATATGRLTVRRTDRPEPDDGVNLLDLPAARRPSSSRIALVQQDPSTSLHPLETVGTQVAAAARAAGASRDGARSRALELLERVGLDADLAARVPARLSGGQRQRAAVALALACEPVLIVADEPTTALDVVARAELLAVLVEVTSPWSDSVGGADKGAADAPALLLVTHDLPAAGTCERVVVLDEGQVVESGDSRSVLTRPLHEVTRAMCEAAREESLAGALAAIESRAAVDDCALCEITQGESGRRPGYMPRSRVLAAGAPSSAQGRHGE
ncbi:ATP-binding cassette domain-containing protein [Actinomyces howellii]|uniref:Glutathione import ATP-binding protein GsiA n=1 Tax=Actinomyces howellii TaxID=52771 RepID=A0A3S4RGU1_9ACTO|nr:ATP-binding cassette domain-containing protein [Actinomyces howellii]VEG29729.1 Glutathione import ATP-binding protein GsiA [Actinomyces howellii]